MFIASYPSIVCSAPSTDRIFAMAEGDQATSGASVIGNLTGQPNIFFNNPFVSATSNPSSLPFAVSNDQNLRDSYIQQWNLNVQHKLPGDVVLDVGYVGSKGTRLIVTFGDLNRPILRTRDCPLQRGPGGGFR